MITSVLSGGNHGFVSTRLGNVRHFGHALVTRGWEVVRKFGRAVRPQTVFSRGFVGQVTMTQCREIAKTKMADLNAHDLEAAAEMIKGSARSMGLQVVEG